MFQETYMYFTSVFGIFTVVSFAMLLAGNLFAMYKMYTSSTSLVDSVHKRTLEHSEKCGCCGQEKSKTADAPSIVGKVVDAAQKLI